MLLCLSVCVCDRLAEFTASPAVFVDVPACGILCCHLLYGVCRFNNCGGCTTGRIWHLLVSADPTHICITLWEARFVSASLLQPDTISVVPSILLVSVMASYVLILLSVYGLGGRLSRSAYFIHANMTTG